MSYRPDFVPNLINAEPAAFLGLSLNEVLKIVVTRVSMSVVVCLMIGLTVYTHIFVGLLAVVIGTAIGFGLTKRKAQQVLVECRGKDPFYSKHNDDIKFERLKLRLEKSGLYKKSGTSHSFLVEDGDWSQR